MNRNWLLGIIFASMGCGLGSGAHCAGDASSCSVPNASPDLGHQVAPNSCEGQALCEYGTTPRPQTCPVALEGGNYEKWRTCAFSKCSRECAPLAGQVDIARCHACVANHASDGNPAVNHGVSGDVGELCSFCP